MGEVGHTSVVWFHVTMPTDSTIAHYMFSYHMLGAGVGRLETFIQARGSSLGPVRSIRSLNTDLWLDSDCYVLPDGFHGDIFLRAVRGDSDFGDIAIDNVKVFQGPCPVKSVACSFEAEKCGYIQTSRSWELKDGSISTPFPGRLDAPMNAVNWSTGDTCISIVYSAGIEDTFVVEAEDETGNIERRKFYNNGNGTGLVGTFTVRALNRFD
ncbi:hypothetical protein DPMN_170562 [Dreissena polymorpha]|uniref:MAM domain-containing protein n=1 Tax=Dreissena polymorpha TaxID=45954 RepID=A0A9D4IED8_DREPO|nr:hypothetical protein DPMN_170562 [Dreissena polymorpha]